MNDNFNSLEIWKLKDKYFIGELVEYGLKNNLNFFQIMDTFHKQSPEEKDSSVRDYLYEEGWINRVIKKDVHRQRTFEQIIAIAFRLEVNSRVENNSLINFLFEEKHISNWCKQWDKY